MKMYDLKTVVVDNIEYSYFYSREKNDRNGNPRYRVFISDPEALAVYEIIVHTYGNIADYVTAFIEEGNK
jgi:hypothetical protein